jgi:hypothetical protein
MRIRSPLAAFAALALVAPLACATVNVSVDYDDQEDFTGYKTYAWLPGTPEATGDPRLDTLMVHQRVHEGIDRTLAAKGYQKAEAGPDFWVAYHLSVEKKIDVYTTNRLYGGYGWTVSIPETRVNEYDEGSLIVDISDAKEKELVWRGIGTGRLRETPREDPEEQKQVVYQVVDEVLADFPPK